MRFLSLLMLVTTVHACGLRPELTQPANTSTEKVPADQDSKSPQNGDSKKDETNKPSDPVDDTVKEPEMPVKPSVPKEEEDQKPVEEKPSVPAVISKEGDGRIEIGPKYTVAPDTQKRDKLSGTIQEFTMNGNDSKIFKGNYTRKIRVYLPPDFVAGKEYPFIVSMDTQLWLEPVRSTVDKLVSDKKLPSLVGVYMEHGGGDGRGSQRGLEYDTVGPNNANFIANEVLPLVEQKYGVKFSKDPEASCIFGGSSSGAAAFTIAWFMPERFRKVLIYSPTFTDLGRDTNYPAGAASYHRSLIKDTAVKPIRVATEVGARNDTTEDNVKTFDALFAKGYHVRFHYALDAGHTDYRVMTQTFAENLLWLWRDFPRK
ncbi:MAG: hypothetical protein EOP10_08200 [Proteobacteria bacterium]|nr:MAG: hypothetical protein EOP10_08200 [Pseudomonadota bacterium]